MADRETIAPLEGEAARAAILKAVKRLRFRAYYTPDLLAEVARDDDVKKWP